MAGPEILDLTALKALLVGFARERDWEKFHTPKNLASALSVEASELLEIFQWLTEEEAKNIKTEPGRKLPVAEELADVLVYAVRLATVLEIDLAQAIEDKMKKNADKYPAAKVKGSSKKYDQY